MTPLLLWALACTASGEDPIDTAPAADADTDTDTDADADTDTDSDTDADTDADSDTDTDSVFERDVFTVYEAFCNDCHHEWGPGDPDALYDTLVTAPPVPDMVVPGDREASYFYDKIAHDRPEDGKARMPPELFMLNEDELAGVAAWIDDGALADSEFERFYNDVWMRRNCKNCHDTWGGMDKTAVHTFLTTQDGVGGRIVVAGDSEGSLLFAKLKGVSALGVQMPIVYEYLDAATIEAVGAWIDSGAPR